MNKPNPDAKSLLEQCLARKDDSSWFQFTKHFQEVISAASAVRFRGGGQEDFEAWLPGWFFARRKLQALYKALLTKIESGECSTSGEQVDYIRNYLATTVATAVVDYFRESRQPGVVAIREEEEGTIVPAAARDVNEQVRRVRQALAELPIELRVAFWIRHAAALGPLDEGDVVRAAEAAAIDPSEIPCRIEAEVMRLGGASRPISSRFIGDLLGLPPDCNGKYAAVDQRVRRARDRLRARLVGDEPGGGG